MFEAGTRVPFAVYWKGKIKPVVSNALVSQLDFLASFAQLIDEKTPDGLDSNEYLDVFMGKSMQARENYVMEAMGRLAYRKGDYVIIPPYDGQKRNETGNEL